MIIHVEVGLKLREGGLEFVMSNDIKVFLIGVCPRIE